MAFKESEVVLEALKQCDFATDSEPADLLGDKKLDCRMEQGILFSAKLAVVRRGQKFGTYVIFRGTESRGLGTWVITNFQAASTAFRVVDSHVHHHGSDKELPIQGCTSKVVAPGRVHQGILRTWSQLWYGTDILDTTFLKPASRWRLIARYAFVATLAVALGVGYDLQGGVTALLAAAAVLLSMAVESGSLERLVHTPSEPQGLPVLESLQKSPPSGPVWFVGHSLGGALATLAFAAYRSRCKTINVECNARLVTFGSPLVGDADFVADFESEHKDLFIHVAHKGDPVTMSPPPRAKELLCIGRPLIGYWGVLFLLASLFWNLVYRFFWEGQAPYATWSTERGLCRLGGRYNWITLFKHTRASYAKHMASADLASDG